MSKENKNEMDLGDNILDFIGKMQDKYYSKKSDKRINSFIKEAKVLTEIESKSFVHSSNEEGVKRSYLNAEGIRLACLDKDGQKTYSIAKDLALGEELFATWAYDQNDEVKDLNILDRKGFDFAIKTMRPALKVMAEEKLKQDSLAKVKKKKSNKPF